MVEVKANLRYMRIAPRKVRLVADFIRGRSVKDALNSLNFTSKKSSPVLIKLIKSALSNARNNFRISADEKDIYIKKITVDGGPMLKRYMPRARGATDTIRKRTSHITLVLEERQKSKDKKSPPKARLAEGGKNKKT